MEDHSPNLNKHVARVDDYFSLEHMYDYSSPAIKDPGPDDRFLTCPALGPDDSSKVETSTHSDTNNEQIIEPIEDENGKMHELIKEILKLPKKLLASESKYLKACFKANEDPIQKVTDQLAHLNLESFALKFTLKWFKNCKRIQAGQDIYAKKPELSLQDWTEDHLETSLNRLVQVYVLAENLVIPRLESHVLCVIGVRAIEYQTLPSLPTVQFLYEHGKRFSALKTTIIDQYAIAATKPKNVFGAEKPYFPPEFVESVARFRQSEAYIDRRWKLITCDRAPDKWD